MLRSHFTLCWHGSARLIRSFRQDTTEAQACCYTTCCSSFPQPRVAAHRRYSNRISSSIANIRRSSGLESYAFGWYCLLWQGLVPISGFTFPPRRYPCKAHQERIRRSAAGWVPWGQHRICFFPGTWLIPPGMNDRNEEDPGKYIDVWHCSFLVDSYMPGMEATKHEPLYVRDDEHWEKVACAPFLDASKTGVLARTIWIPNLSFIPSRYRRHWGEHCLLRRRNSWTKYEENYIR